MKMTTIKRVTLFRVTNNKNNERMNRGTLAFGITLGVDDEFTLLTLWGFRGIMLSSEPIFFSVPCLATLHDVTVVLSLF